MATQHAQTAPHVTGVHRDLGWWLKRGAISGLVAGIIFAAFEMMAAGIMRGNFVAPLRMIGAVGLGPQALNPQYSIASAAVTGVVIHLIYSVLAGIVFGAIVVSLPSLADSTAVLITSASIYGLLMWLVNFYLIAPAAGWEWFPTRANALVQGFIAHTFFYGTALGLLLSPRKGAHKSR